MPKVKQKIISKEKKRAGGEVPLQALLPDSRDALSCHLASFATSSVGFGGSTSAVGVLSGATRVVLVLVSVWASP